MGSLSRASRQSMTMGQTSSQVRSTETGTPGADQSAPTETSNGENNKRKKARRKYKAATEDPGREQDETVAPAMFSAVNVNGKDNIEGYGRNEAHQVTNKGGKRKRQRHESRERKGNLTVRDRDDGSSKRARLNKSINTVKSQTVMLQSSSSTKDVTMEEPGASLLPGDGQEVCSSGPSTKTQTVVKPKPIMQRLLAEVEKKLSDDPIQLSDRLPSLVVENPQRQNHLKERKDQSQSRVESSDAAAQEQPNRPGEHGFDFACATFNDDFSKSDMESANLFITSNIGFSLPINPVLINEPPIPISIPLGKSTVAHRHENANQQLYIKAPAEATGDVGSHVDMARGPTDQPEDVGGDEQSRNPPETEGLSSDAESYNEWSLNSEDSDETTSKAKGKMTPPPLAKPSKPLGNKTQQGGKKAKNYDPPLDIIAKRGGVWTQAEISRLENFRDNYCKENELSTFQFNALVQSVVRYDMAATALFNELHATFPYRTRMSTMRVCRRRFHNFPARGTWTQSEDENLKQAVSEKGRSWTAVGERINRFPEDCRDRYRNYHVNAQNRNRDSWTDAEILNLCTAVHDCMVKMKGHNAQARLEKFVGREVPESESESDEEVRDMKLINWQIVSDAMGPGGGRSRLQCSLKWAQLRMVERAKYMKRVNDALKGRSPAENGKTKQPKGRNWRARQAQRTLDNMKAGDRYDFLQAFATCNAKEESNIAWKLLGDEAFRSRWTVIERKAALQIFKDEVPEGNNMDYRDVANRLLTKWMAENSHRLGERWERSRDFDVNVERRRQRLAEKESRRKSLPKELEDEKTKRDKFVITSDDEESENAVQETTEDKGILLSQSGTYHEAEVEMSNEDMSAEASNRKVQEGLTNLAIDTHTNRSSARDASSRLIVASAHEELLKALPHKNAYVEPSAPATKGLPARTSGETLHPSAAAPDYRTREDQPDEDVGVDTDDDSLFGKGNESPEPDEAAAQDATQEALSNNGSDDVTPARTAAEIADDEAQANSSDGKLIDAAPARKGKAGADVATQEESSEEEATDVVTLVPQSNALPTVDEAAVKDRLHDRLSDEDKITATSPLSEVPDSPLRSSTATTDDETQPHDDDDDDDVRTDSDTDSLFGKPLPG